MHFLQIIFYKTVPHKVKSKVSPLFRSKKIFTASGNCQSLPLFNSKKNVKKKQHVDSEDPKTNRSLFELKNKLKDGFE